MGWSAVVDPAHDGSIVGPMAASKWYDPDGRLVTADQIPGYSTNIAAAWSAIEKSGLFYGVHVMCLSLFENGWTVGKRVGGFEFEDYVETSETAPLALCLAALKFVREQKS